MWEGSPSRRMSGGVGVWTERADPRPSNRVRRDAFRRRTSTALRPVAPVSALPRTRREGFRSQRCLSAAHCVGVSSHPCVWPYSYSRDVVVCQSEIQRRGVAAVARRVDQGRQLHREGRGAGRWGRGELWRGATGHGVAGKTLRTPNAAGSSWAPPARRSPRSICPRLSRFATTARVGRAARQLRLEARGGRRGGV